MAFNVRSGGLAVNVEVDEEVKSGDVVVIGDLAGIAEIDAQEGDDGNYHSTLALEGIARVEGSGSVGDVFESGGKAVGIITHKGDGTHVWVKLVPNVGGVA